MRAVVSVIGKDMVGILAKVSAECENANMNVIEVSQTLLQDMFAMIMLIDITKGNTALADFAAHMENVGKQSGLTIHVMHEDIFNSMHKI
jgi:ACT domain-containing protein